MDNYTVNADNTGPATAATAVPSPLEWTSRPEALSPDFNPGQPTSSAPPTSTLPPAYAALTNTNSALGTQQMLRQRLDSALDRAEKYERLAFTFCKMGTAGLLAWLLTPPIFVLLVATIAVALYGRALTLGLARSKCFLRKPALIVAFWGVVAVADVAWLVLSRRAG